LAHRQADAHGQPGQHHGDGQDAAETALWKGMRQRRPERDAEAQSQRQQRPLGHVHQSGPHVGVGGHGGDGQLDDLPQAHREQQRLAEGYQQRDEDEGPTGPNQCREKPSAAAEAQKQRSAQNTPGPGRAPLCGRRVESSHYQGQRNEGL
jgi:hypothetical protein